MQLGRVARRLTGRLRPSPVGISARDFFELAFSRPPDQTEGDLLLGLVGPNVSSLSQARAVLRAFDQQNVPSRMTIRFSDEDLELVDLGEFSLWLDRRDVSVSAVILDRGVWEPHITEILGELLHPGDTFVDVGANVGYHSFHAAARVGQDGAVIAFEPDAENCRLMWLSREQNSTPNVDIRPVALDSSAGLRYLTTHLGSNGGFMNDGTSTARGGQGVLVQTDRLDNAVHCRVDVLKLDVEGAEFAVLRGALGTIERHRPHIILEFSLEMSQRVSGGRPPEELQSLLDLGYALHVVCRDGGTRAVESAAALVARWPDELHIEDLWLEPTGDAVPRRTS